MIEVNFYTLSLIYEVLFYLLKISEQPIMQHYFVPLFIQINFLHVFFSGIVLSVHPLHEAQFRNVKNERPLRSLSL